MTPDRNVRLVCDYWRLRGYLDVRAQIVEGENLGDGKAKIPRVRSNLKNGLPPSMNGAWRRAVYLGRGSR